MKKLALLLLLAGCTAQQTCNYDPVIEDLQIQVADARRSQHLQETEIGILEDKVRRQDPAKLRAQIQMLQERIGELERQHERQAKVVDKEVSALKGAMASVVELAQHTAGKTISVKAGDTLEKIARREGTSIKQLKEANGLTSDRIYVGQELAVH